MSKSLVSSIMATFCRENAKAWFESYCQIKVKGGAFVEGMPLHSYQKKILDVLQWCKENDKPARIIGLKPRRGGSSTVSVAALYHFLMWNAGKYGCIMGGSDFQGFNLFSMMKIMAHSDRIPVTRAKVMDKEARFPNGSTCVRINASNENAGLSGGYDFLLVTELAKFAQEGVAAAGEVLAGALKCVPFLSGTTVIIESTAEGIGNEYERIYSTGVTFEEFKAGKVGYIKIFSPWFEFTDHVLDPSTMGITGPESLTTEETDLAARHSLSLAQVAWMRYTIKDQCKGDFENFKENYPFDDVSCFLLSGRRVFSAKGIQKMRDDIPTVPVATGNLNFVPGQNEKFVNWQPALPNSCRILRWEPPREGMKYLLALDPATGASNTTGSDPDNHAAIIWRAGYHHGTQWYPPRVVAQLIDDYELWINQRKYQLQWDIDMLEREVWKLMLYYQAILVPEMNMERGLVELIKLRGGNIIVQEVPNRREGTLSNRYGVYTYGGANGGTRGAYLAELAKGIREYGHIDPVTGWSRDRCEIYSPMILDELETFIKKANGREEAMQGKHDDLVLGTAIGLSSIDAATTYRTLGGYRPDPFEIVDRAPRNSTYS